MTRRKKWPHEAEWARQEALAAAERGLRAARPVLEGRVRDVAEVMRVIAVLVDALHRVVLALVRARTGKE